MRSTLNQFQRAEFTDQPIYQGTHHPLRQRSTTTVNRRKKKGKRCFLFFSPLFLTHMHDSSEGFVQQFMHGRRITKTKKQKKKTPTVNRDKGTNSETRDKKDKGQKRHTRQTFQHLCSCVIFGCSYLLGASSVHHFLPFLLELISPIAHTRGQRKKHTSPFGRYTWQGASPSHDKIYCVAF